MSGLRIISRRLFAPHSCLVMSAVVCLLLLGTAQQASARGFGLTFQGFVQTLNTGGSITLSSPSGMVVDSAGDIFVTDTGNGRIVEVNAQGTASVLTISGLSPALVSPTGIAIDGSGNLYITDADPANSRVVKVSSSGAGSVIATGSATLSSPKGIALDQAGNIFIADTGHNQIVEVPFVGSALALTITGLSGPSTLNTPLGLAVDVSGNLYIADSANDRIVKVAAGGTSGSVVSIDEVDLDTPSGVAVDSMGNIFISDTGNNRIAEVDTAGNGAVQLAVSNASVTLSGPLGIAVDIFGTVYIVDTGNGRSLIVNPWLDMNTTDTTFYASSLDKSNVGFGHIALGSSIPTSRVLNFTIGSPVASLGGVNVFTSGTQSLDFQIVSGANTTCSSSSLSGTSCTVEISFLPTAPGLRKGALVLYDPSLKPVLTLPLYGFSDAPVAALNPNAGSVINTGALATANPYELALDGAGNMYVGVYSSSNVTKILAGGGSASVVSLGTPGGTAVRNITGVALDGAGNLFIGDHQNSRILVVTPGGVVSVLNITGLSTALGFPTALAFDAAGNLYIADFTNGQIIEVSSLIVTGSTSTGKATVIQTGGYSFNHGNLTGMTVDSMGNIYAAARTQNNSRIVKVTAAGVVSLLSIPNNITPAINNPQGVGVDAMGNIYIVDTTNNRIVEITTAGVATALGISGLPSPATTLGPTLFGVTVDPSGNLYIMDWTNNRIVFVNVSGAALSFPNTAVGATSAAKTATVVNLGNLPLNFSTNPTYTADFQENGGDANPCGSSTSLSAGTLCDISVLFTPQSVGSLSAGITVTNNTLNIAGSTQQVSVSGNGFSSGDTTAVSVSVAPSPATDGQTVTITATVTDTTSGHTSTVPTGSLTFMDTLGTTSVTLNGGSAVTLDATGKATLSGVTLSGVGLHTITANYAGVSGTYLPNSNTTTVTVVTVAPDFTISVTSSNGGTTSAPISAGGTATYSFALAPVSGTTYPAAVTFTVSGLPPGATATISPNPLPANSPVNTPIILTIRLAGQTATLHRNTLRNGLALVMLGMLLLPFGGKARRAVGKRGLHTFLLVLALAGAGTTLGLTGCGSHNSGYLANAQKTYSVVVTATSGSTSHKITVNLTVQ